MASARDLRKKIKSITNTRKITRTMELVATSKAKRAQDRVIATTPYSEKLTAALGRLAEAGTVDHPLLEKETGSNKVAVLLITANRGLCGGYNSNTLSMAEKLRMQLLNDGKEVDLYVVGRKGMQRMKFLKLPVLESWADFDDRPSFKDAADIADLFIQKFVGGEVGRVMVVSTRFLSAGRQEAQRTQLLPIESPSSGEESSGKAVEFIFEPTPAEILEELLPLSVKNVFYRLLVEAVASEQIARRVAMKRATDSADEMIQDYTRMYNRSRQAGITQEINEIVSGASALE